jgi:hypothetical protein
MHPKAEFIPFHRISAPVTQETFRRASRNAHGQEQEPVECTALHAIPSHKALGAKAHRPSPHHVFSFGLPEFHNGSGNDPFLRNFMLLEGYV